MRLLLSLLLLASTFVANAAPRAEVIIARVAMNGSTLKKWITAP